MKTVIEMALEAGLADSDGVVHAAYQLERFAELIRADAITDEREACIRIMFDYCDDDYACEKAAELIRARGNT